MSAEPDAAAHGDIHAHRVLILDFGSQYTQLIARRVRECGAYSEIHPWDMDEDALRAFRPSGIVLSGGPESVNLDDPPRVAPAVFDLGVPVLGICYGMQLTCLARGAEVTPADHREFGRASLQIAEDAGPLFRGVPQRTTVWMSHGDQIAHLDAAGTPHDRGGPAAVRGDGRFVVGTAGDRGPGADQPSPGAAPRCSVRNVQRRRFAERPTPWPASGSMNIS